MACGQGGGTLGRAMQRSYAVTWQEAGAPPHSGKLELRPDGVRLEGSNGTGPAGLVVPYADVAGWWLAGSGERLDNRPTLVLERRGGGSLRVASVVAPGIVSELVEQLTELRR